jgi:hypothetical protein
MVGVEVGLGVTVAVGVGVDVGVCDGLIVNVGLAVRVALGVVVIFTSATGPPVHPAITPAHTTSTTIRHKKFIAYFLFTL